MTGGGAGKYYSEEKVNDDDVEEKKTHILRKIKWHVRTANEEKKSRLTRQQEKSIRTYMVAIRSGLSIGSSRLKKTKKLRCASIEVVLGRIEQWRIIQ